MLLSLNKKKGIIKEDAVYEKQELLNLVWGWMSQNPNWLFINFDLSLPSILEPVRLI